MYDSVLVPVDESTTETAALYHVAEMANATGADVTLLYVADTNLDSVTAVDGEVVDALEREGEDVLAEASDVLESLGVAPDTDVVQGDPAHTIVDYAERYGFDVVVMPTHARSGLSRAILGSVTEKVVRLSSVHVLTARMREDEELEFPYERVLVPVDGSEASDRAVAHALDLATALDATVHVLSFVDDASLGPDVRTGTVEAEMDADAEQAVEDVAALAADRDVAVETRVERGTPDEVIGEVADDVDAHVVVMGTTGRRGVDRILLGSVAEKTVRSATVPVVTVGDGEAPD